MSTQFLKLFPTNVSTTQVEDFESINLELEQLPFMHDGSHQIVARNNVWDLREQYPVLQTLYNEMTAAVVAYADNYHVGQEFKPEYFTFTDGWINETKRDDGLFTHNHKLSHLVCVYYWSITNESGAIDFIDPRGSLGFISLDKSTSLNIFRMQPKLGDLLVFPGWLLHYVHPNKTDVPRKIIGANIKLNDDVKFSTPGIAAQETGTSIMRLG